MLCELLDLSINFSAKIIELVDMLRKKNENLISAHIGRTGISVGASINQAISAQFCNDYIVKLKTALDFANETAYWILIAQLTVKIDDVLLQDIRCLYCRIRCMLINLIQQFKTKQVAVKVYDILNF